MSDETNSVVVAVVSDPAGVEPTLARVGRDQGDGAPDVAVLCPVDDADEVARRAADAGWAVTVEGVDPFEPGGLAAAVERLGADAVVVADGVPFATADLGARLDGVPVRTASTAVSSRRRGLDQPAGVPQRVTLFALALGFYLLLGEPTAFDVATGVASATVVVLVLSRVAFADPPTLRRTVPRVLRAALFVPYLLWAVVRANLALAAVLVDPRLPIDPSVETVETRAESGLERAVLANAITVTPGTVTVDVRGSTLVVHTLTGSSRAGLREGRLQRAVRYVFAGRRSDAGDGNGADG